METGGAVVGKVACVETYRRGAVWRYAVWIDEIRFLTGSLKVDPETDEQTAIEVARTLFPEVERVTVKRGHDFL